MAHSWDEMAVRAIATEMAWIVVTPQGLELQEIAPGLTVEAVQAATDAPLRVSATLREMIA